MEAVFYIIAVLALIIVFKENNDYKQENKKLLADLDYADKTYQELEKRHLKVEKTDVSLRKEIKELTKLKDENNNLRYILKKIKTSYINNPSSSKNELDKFLKEEYNSLKKEESLVKEEYELSSEDNELLIQENHLLRQQNENYEKQIDELRESNKHIHKYIDTINNLNNEVQVLIK